MRQDRSYLSATFVSQSSKLGLEREDRTTEEHYPRINRDDTMVGAQPTRSVVWSGREDLNLRHPAPKAGALPGCATPRQALHFYNS